MITDILKYYIKRWYIFFIVFAGTAGGMFLFQKHQYNWESAIMCKHMVIDIGCGVLIAAFVVFAIFSWKRD